MSVAALLVDLRVEQGASHETFWTLTLQLFAGVVLRTALLAANILTHGSSPRVRSFDVDGGKLLASLRY